MHLHPNITQVDEDSQSMPAIKWYIQTNGARYILFKLRWQCSGCDMDFRMRVSAPFEATVVAVLKVASLWTTSIISTELGVMLAYLKICIFLQNTNKKPHNLIILFSDICLISDIHLALAWRIMINCSHQHWYQFLWRSSPQVLKVMTKEAEVSGEGLWWSYKAWTDPCRDIMFSLSASPQGRHGVGRLTEQHLTGTGPHSLNCSQTLNQNRWLQEQRWNCCLCVLQMYLQEKVIC